MLLSGGTNENIPSAPVREEVRRVQGASQTLVALPLLVPVRHRTQGVTDAGGPISGAACLPWRIVSQEEKEEEERVSS